MDDRITLKVVSQTWHATFHGSDAERVHRLFGTATIPTPFKVGTDAETVRQKVAGLNPGYVVEFIS